MIASMQVVENVVHIGFSDGTRDAVSVQVVERALEGLLPGPFPLMLSESQRKRAERKSQSQGVSLNAFIEGAVRDRLARR